MQRIKNRKRNWIVVVHSMVIPFACFLVLEAAAQQDTSVEYSASGHFQNLFHKTKPEFAFSGKSQADFKQWQSAFLHRLKQVLGLNLMEGQISHSMLRAEKKGTGEAEDYLIERWLVWTEPTVPLPVVLLIPKNGKGKMPLVVVTHGHGRQADLYEGIYPKISAIAMEAVRSGYLVVEPTIRAFGSTRTEEDKRDGNSFSCHRQLMRDLLIGRTVIGDRVWDMSRVLDWAIPYLPVDCNKIAITGNSGGGTVALFAAACDDRITVAVPSSAFCSFSGSIGAVDHCDCNYVPGLLNLGEMGDVAGLIAPRPFCAVNGKEDPIFPIGETRKSFLHLREIYIAAGSPDHVSLYEGDGGHKYYPEGAWPFIKRYFSELE